MIMETTTKYDTIINFFLDNWIIATIVVAAIIIYSFIKRWNKTDL